MIGTHSGTFHCDEVMATSILLHTKQFENSMIFRTRDETLLEHFDVICDIGGVYDPETNRFDHH